MPSPNRAFWTLLAVAALGVSILGGGIARILLSGAGPAGVDGGWVEVWCLLVPTAKYTTPHLLVYLFLAPAILGFLAGLRSAIGQGRKSSLFGARLRAHQAGIEWAKISHSTIGLGIASQVVLVRSAEPCAFCYGLLRPRICVTTALVRRLTQPELEAVLLHEKYHLEQRDPLKVAAGRVVVAGLFFLPVLRGLFDRYLLAKELAADDRAVRGQGRRRSLASAMEKLLTLGGSASPALLRDAAGVGLINHRIDYLLGEGTSSWDEPTLPAIAASLLVLALGAALLLVPPAALHNLGLSGFGSHSWCQVA